LTNKIYIFPVSCYFFTVGPIFFSAICSQAEGRRWLGENSAATLDGTA